MLDLFDLVGGDQDGAVFIEIVVQQAGIELLAVENIQAQRGFVQYQKPHIDGHHQGQVQLCDHALGKLLHFLIEGDLGVRHVLHAGIAGEALVDSFGYIDQLPDLDPARQNGNVSDEAHVFHQGCAIA